MILVAGLGNPGPKYANHRHNVGFRVVDRIIATCGLTLRQSRHHSYVATGRIAGERLLVLKPKTFMNDSGRALGSALRYHKLKPGQVIVIYDELDLALGKVRVRTGGGHAGHNGIRSIVSHIGPDFRRMRVGIGHPGDKRRVHRYVLSDFSRVQAEQIDRTISAIVESLPILIGGDAPGFMSRVAYLAPPAGPKETADGPQQR